MCGTAGAHDRHRFAGEGNSLSESESSHRLLPPAPVLAPPQSPDALYGPPGRVPQAYQRYPQYQVRRAGSSGQWYPPGDNAQYNQQGWPPPTQWTYGGWSPTPPPRRSSPVVRLLLGLIGIAAALFFAIIVLAALATPSAPVRADVATHVPAPPSDPNTTPVDPGDAAAVLEDSSLYDQGGLSNGNCTAQDLGAASSPEQTRFYQSLLRCLNDEWRPPIRSAGFPYARPGLVVFDAPVSTPCGSASPRAGRTLAFYCPGDSVMYADVPQMRRYFGDLEVAYAIVIGHEFGHHVQAETGVLTAYHDEVFDNFGGRTELSRRVELQASCLGGLFLGAVSATFPIDEQRLAQLQQVAGNFGDQDNASAEERDHGSGESNRAWIFTGYNNNDLATCNTFVASPDDVD